MKKLIPLIMLFNLSAFARDYKNPHVGKNIGSHTKEFLAFEIVSDFHNGVEKYNSERKELPEAKLVDNHYEILDGANKVVFDINLALRGDFFYNDARTNLKDLKLNSQPKTVFYIFINDAEASSPKFVSTILLAALVKLDANIQISNHDNRQLLLNKIKEVHSECMKDNRKDTPIDHSNVPNMEKLLNQINANGNDRFTSEESMVNKFLSAAQEPNCSNVPKAAAIQYGNGETEAQRRQILRDGSAQFTADGQPLELTDEAKSRVNADQELCAQLAQLKSCLVSENSGLYDIKGTDTSRSFIKEKVRDDVSPYIPTNATSK
jgi:hypothetical protein